MEIEDNRKKSVYDLKPGDVVCFYDDKVDKDYALIAHDINGCYGLIDLKDGSAMVADENAQFIDFGYVDIESLMDDLNKTWNSVEKVNAHVVIGDK